MMHPYVATFNDLTPLRPTDTCGPHCGHWDELQELERLRALITAWADAETADGFHQEPECGCGAPLCTASAALRKAVGR